MVDVRGVWVRAVQRGVLHRESRLEEVKGLSQSFNHRLGV